MSFIKIMLKTLVKEGECPALFFLPFGRRRPRVRERSSPFSHQTSVAQLVSLRRGAGRQVGWKAATSCRQRVAENVASVQKHQTRALDFVQHLFPPPIPEACAGGVLVFVRCRVP